MRWYRYFLCWVIICNICLQISRVVCNIQVRGSAPEMGVTTRSQRGGSWSETGKGKLDESQGRKASGLHDLGLMPAGLPSKMAFFDVASPFIC